MPRDLADLKARITAAVKNIDAPMLMRVWQELEYLIDVCCVTRGIHIEHRYLLTYSMVQSPS
jgi:pyruvate-formate lyase-activating enzyme